MPFVFKRLALLMSIAAAFAADKKTTFRPPPAESMAHRQTNEQVTIGADPYSTASKAKTAFGKLDPNQFGVLPVLVVIQNDTKQTLDAGRLQVQYTGPGHAKVEATPAADVKYLNGPKRPNFIPGPGGGIAALTGKEDTLYVLQTEDQAFIIRMTPPGQTASAFFYFQPYLKPGAAIFVNSLAEASTGKLLFYFEIPLE